MNPQIVLSGIALVGLMVLGGFATWHEIPGPNLQFMSTIVGAIAGALVTGAASQRATKITNSNGPDATIQQDGEKP